jgi:hypothetical protein
VVDCALSGCAEPATIATTSTPQDLVMRAIRDSTCTRVPCRD